MIVQQFPQFALERDWRDFSTAVRPLTRVALSVRVAVRIGIDNLDHQKTSCAFDLITHCYAPPLLYFVYLPFFLPSRMPQDSR